MNADKDMNLNTQKVYLVHKKMEGLLLIVCSYILVIQTCTDKIKCGLGAGRFLFSWKPIFRYF